MKILTAAQIHELDKYTIEHEPVASIDLMERAASKFVNAIKPGLETNTPIWIFCGMGNNGGDGLASARILAKAGFKNIRCAIVKYSDKGSSDFEINLKRLNGLLPLEFIEVYRQIPAIEKNALVIDAIFGSGLNRPVDDIAASVIEAINQSGAKVYSIDIPSGLYCDKQNAADDCIIHSTQTFTFGTPKLTFLFPENGKYVSAFEVLDIGLNKEFAAGINSDYEYIDAELIKGIFHGRAKFSHKGTYGHACIVAGSYGKMGAAVLSVSAALKSGAGLVTAAIPKGGNEIMQISNPEAMVMVDADEHIITSLPDLKDFSSIGIGPGLGRDEDTMDFLESFLLSGYTGRMVLDADALNIISAYQHLKEMLPRNSVLTPHPGEFKRLTGAWQNDMQKLEHQLSFSKQHNLIVVLKGAHTSISTPDGKIYFNSTGNPGMAKGGSGDVLTGIITSLLAQGYSSENAAVIGVYIHGLAGDLAVQNLSETGITARDIINYLPLAFKQFEERL